MSATMKEGEHYGRIPGCGDKADPAQTGGRETMPDSSGSLPPTTVQERQLEGGHREYRVTTTLTSITTQVLIGQGRRLLFHDGE